MSYELGLKGKLDTAKQDLTLPKTILENISNELKAETDGEIEGMVLPYKGPIQSYMSGYVVITSICSERAVRRSGDTPSGLTFAEKLTISSFLMP